MPIIKWGVVEITIYKQAMGVGFAVAVCLAHGQTVRDVKLSGSIEQFLVSGGFGTETKTRDRFTRFQGTASMGKWDLRATYWHYPFCGWYDLDETTLSYKGDSFSWRIGRFLLPIGQTNWDDQWYSGFVFLPLIESRVYKDQALLERTSVGTDAEHSFGNHAVRISLTSSKPEPNRVIASRFDRGSARWTYYHEGLTLGASVFTDMTSGGHEEQLVSADVRWTKPQWTVRAEALSYRSPSLKVRGFFVDTYHRPKGLSDLTFVGRYETRQSHGARTTDLQAWTLGAKARVGGDVVLNINYTGGPDMNRIFLGGGWSFGLTKTIRF